MRVEILELLKEGKYHLIRGDRLAVPDEIGASWCSQGRAVEIHDHPYGRRATDRVQLTT